MEIASVLPAVGMLAAALAFFSFIELLIPLHACNAWSRKHVGPNLALTVLIVTTNLLLNIPFLLGLLWLRANGWGLFNALELPPLVELIGGVLVLDLAWYVTHRSMHGWSALWRFHAVHHSDIAVDATTTIRQHPGESLIRYVFLIAFGFSAGVSPEAFALYRVWSAIQGYFEHANIALPQWLDTSISLLFPSPNMHKVHHSREARFTDTNYSNVFSIWDRLFGTFTPAKFGRHVNYGLDEYDAPDRQTLIGLFRLPFKKNESAPLHPTPVSVAK